MPTASSEAQLRSMLQAPMQKAVTSTAEKVHKQHRKNVESVVYNGYDPTEYKRTKEFLDAWKVGNDGLGSFVNADEEYDGTLLKTHGGAWPYNRGDYSDSTVIGGVHQSFLTGAASDEELPDYIFYGYQGALNKHIPARNAFEKTDNWLDESKVVRLVASGMASAGLQVVQKGGADKTVY